MFLRGSEEAKLHQAGEKIIKGVTVEVVANRFADLSPAHAPVPGLGDDGHDQIGGRHMLTLLSTIPAAEPKSEMIAVLP